jgi:hypothetical protein
MGIVSVPVAIPAHAEGVWAIATREMIVTTRAK